MAPYADNPPAPDDMLTCLSKAAAGFDRPPKILTFSRAPSEGLLSQVFGPEAATNLLVRPGATAGGPGDFTTLEGAPASPLDVKPVTHALLLRFVDSAAFDLTAGYYRGWLARGAGVIVHFPLARSQIGILSEAGFRESRTFVGSGRDTTVFLRPPHRLPPAPDRPAPADRAAPRRLVIVDPCLGGARGHYVPYARSLTQGAAALGADVVWGCHRRLDPASVPNGVEVRRCFPRCFFDLDAKGLATVDLSPELLAGWAALLDEFDEDGTHFLAHNTDAHLIRAAAGLLGSAAPMHSALHLGFHTSPRRMPGRAQGEEAHRVVLRMRRVPQWERSLFFWAENERLGRWMSEWLQAPIPTLPLVAPSGQGANRPKRKPKGRLTLSVLGESRPSKGFLDLPDIIDRVAAESSLGKALTVVIQNCRPVNGRPEEHDDAVARLRRHSFVEIVDGVLEADSYARRLAEADVLLLPYDPEIYNLRGSGILTEGVSRGAIILTRAGTAMEDAASDGVVLTYETPDDVVAVLKGLIDRLGETLGRAREMAVRFRRANTPERFLAALGARAAGAQDTAAS